MSTPNKLYSRSGIREELMKVAVDTRHLWNAHLVAFGRDHEKPCSVCLRYEGEFSAINRMLRHFGGRFQWRDAL